MCVCVSEIDRKLRAVNSLLSPEPPDRRTRRRVSHPPPDDDDIIITGSNDDDVIIMMSPSGDVEGSPYSSSVREFPLKVRCRTDVHKISVLSVRRSPPVIPRPQRPRCDVICVLLMCFQSTPLRDVVAQLSVILDVPCPRLLLMREEVELPTDSTVGEHGLGIADIIGESRDLSSKQTHRTETARETTGSFLGTQKQNSLCCCRVCCHGSRGRSCGRQHHCEAAEQRPRLLPRVQFKQSL